MEIILLERVAKLGHMGEVLKVKDGYARNFLLPNGKALRASAANRAKFERDRVGLEAKNAETRGSASDESAKIDGQNYVIIRQAGESGQLFGSVSPRDIADGMYKVNIAIHPEVVVSVNVNVARSVEEAEAQARGDSLKGPVSDRAEARAAAEALFDEIGSAGNDE
jgi:large subunit ribosomal protein L9